MAKSNNADAFRIQQGMMVTTGVWPTENAGISFRVRGFLSWGLGIVLCLTMFMEAFKDLNDFTKLSEILYIMISVTSYLIKLIGFTFQRKTFCEITDVLKDSIFMSYPEELDHYMVTIIKRSTFIANSYRYLCLCCMIMYAVYPAMDHKILPFPFPYDVGIYRYPFYVFQVISISLSAWNNSCLDTLLTSLMGVGSAQLDILSGKIKTARNINDKADEGAFSEEMDQLVEKRLSQCVRHHLAIIKYLELVEKVFTVGLFAQLVSFVIVSCNTIFHLVLISVSSSQSFMLANYFSIQVAQVSLYCWHGNEILWKSTQIQDACYSLNWYNCGSRIRKYLFIMMERSKRPLTITALKFTHLSLVTYTSIMRWSYSYMTLLLNMYYKRN